MSEQAQQPQSQPEKFLAISEKVVNQIFAGLTRIAWAEANPIISLLRENLREIQTQQTQPTPTEGGE